MVFFPSWLCEETPVSSGTPRFHTQRFGHKLLPSRFFALDGGAVHIWQDHLLKTLVARSANTGPYTSSLTSFSVISLTEICSKWYMETFCCERFKGAAHWKCFLIFNYSWHGSLCNLVTVLDVVVWTLFSQISFHLLKSLAVWACWLCVSPLHPRYKSNYYYNY